MNGSAFRTALAVGLACGCGLAAAAPRDVQIRTVNIQTGVVELHNFGAAAELLDGWQFCTFDDNEIFLYTGPTGMNGITVAAGGSLFVHTLNDAPGAPDRINLSALGGFFALPLDTGPYVMSTYSAGLGFIDPNRIADHLMWNIGGVPGPTSGRGSVAVAAGLWTSTTDWISTAADTAQIRLADLGGGLLHGPADYDIVAAIPGDTDGDGDVDLIDYGVFNGCMTGPGGGLPPGCGDVDLDADVDVDVDDFAVFQESFTG